MSVLVTDGEKVDWSARGVPAHIETYLHEDFVALWDAARKKHVAIPRKGMTQQHVNVALFQLGARASSY